MEVGVRKEPPTVDKTANASSALVPESRLEKYDDHDTCTL